ncbi:MAG: hypothetical protein M1838_000136 [Thelocarpon superellum]|nr:MAG: hypothetical protein M1838_000136 [Thelocarpon superellum]
MMVGRSTRQCDRARPTCTPCRKSRRTCLGYRDQGDVIFRDETHATRTKAERATSSLVASSPRPSPAVEVARSGDCGLWISRYLPQPVELQATSLFVYNYVQPPQALQSNSSHVHCLVGLVAREAPDSHLSRAMLAISIAFMSNVVRQPSLMVRANTEYGRALALTNTALAHPIEATTDRTLLTVLLLTMFVVIASPNDTVAGHKAEDSHIDGVAALIKLRGKARLRTPVEAKLFDMARGNLVMSYLSRGKAIDFLTDMMDELPVDDAVNDQLGRLTMELPNLRAAAEGLVKVPNPLVRLTKAVQILGDVVALDQRLVRWSQSVPAAWARQTVQHVVDRPATPPETWAFYPGDVDVYQDLWVADSWNTYRWARLVTGRMMVRIVARLRGIVPAFCLPAVGSPLEVVLELVNEICASVPFILGYATRAMEKEDSGVNALGGYFLLTPLAVACSVDEVSEAQRRWLRGRLTHISRQMGINRAAALVEVLPPGPENLRP